MNQSKLILIIFLITSVALGDKLYLKNGVVYEGKYGGIVDGRPMFITADTYTRIFFKPEEFIRITNDDGDIIFTEEEVRAQLSAPERKGIITTYILRGLFCLGVLLLVLWFIFENIQVQIFWGTWG